MEDNNYEDTGEGIESDCDTSSSALVSASSFRIQRRINNASQKTNYKQRLLDVLKEEIGVVEEGRTLMLLFVHTTVQILLFVHTTVQILLFVHTTVQILLFVLYIPLYRYCCLYIPLYRNCCLYCTYHCTETAVCTVHTTVQKLLLEDSFRPSSCQRVFSCHLPRAAPVMSFRVPFSCFGAWII